MTVREDHANELFDLLEKRGAKGYRNVDIMRVTGWNLQTFNTALHDLRLALEGDSINVVCEPDGSMQPWVYRLVGSMADAAPWAQNRIRDTESRLTTQHAVASSIVGATDARTKDGKKARLMERSLRRLTEDLSDLEERL